MAEQDVAGLYLGAADALDLDDVVAKMGADGRAHVAGAQRERDVREVADHLVTAEEAEIAAAFARGVLTVPARELLEVLAGDDALEDRVGTGPRPRECLGRGFACARAPAGTSPWPDRCWKLLTTGLECLTQLLLADRRRLASRQPRLQVLVDERAPALLLRSMSRNAACVIPLSRNACSSWAGAAERALPLRNLGLDVSADLIILHDDGRVPQRRLHEEQLVDALLEQSPVPHAAAPLRSPASAAPACLPRQQCVLDVEVQDRAVAYAWPRCGRCAPIARPAAEPAAARPTSRNRPAAYAGIRIRVMVPSGKGRAGALAPARVYIPCAVQRVPVLRRCRAVNCPVAAAAAAVPGAALPGKPFRRCGRTSLLDAPHDQGNRALEQLRAVLLAEREPYRSQRHDVTFAVDDAGSGTPSPAVEPPGSLFRHPAR
jgi:hypothetical protein